MKRIRVILFCILAVAVTFSSRALGTYGAFTGSAESVSNTFQSGTLKVLLDAGNPESASETLNLDYGKFAAGDSISRDFYIKNCGSLPFISKIFISNQNSPIFNDLLCEINLYYREINAPDKPECKYTLYSGQLSDFSKTAMKIEFKKDMDIENQPVSELLPDEGLRCEVVLTLPEDAILTDEAFNAIKQSVQSVIIEIDTTQVNNTEFQ